MILKILSHPVFIDLNFHMPMVLDLSHPLIMLQGENGSGKSTLLHSLYHALRNDQIEGYSYRLLGFDETEGKVLLFDAEQHNPRLKPELFAQSKDHIEFLQIASHGQIMLSLFQQTFPSLPDGTILLLDEPEMALSPSNQRRVVKMLKELVDTKRMRIIAATHSLVLIEDPQTYVINLDRYINRNVIDPTQEPPGQSTIH